MDSPLACKKSRRFGVEIELNTPSGLVVRPDTDAGETPEGTEYLARLIQKTTGKSVEIHGWHYTNNNSAWVIKYDTSCGLEVCSPVFKGGRGLRELLDVVEALKHSDLRADARCSLHIHVNVEDLVEENFDSLASVVAYWIKCEPVFFDLMPAHRKLNRYCRPIGMSELISIYRKPDWRVVELLSYSKYFSLNTYHMHQGRRNTIEFRIGDNSGCTDPEVAKNWVRLITHFVDVTKDLPLPEAYNGDALTGMAWLDPIDVFTLLGFDQPLDDDLREVRDWFLRRGLEYGFNSGQRHGIWSNEGRKIAYGQFTELGLRYLR